MKILIIGAGMYVTGRGESGIGTILSSLAETSKTIPIEEVLVVAKSEANKEVVTDSVNRINQTIGSDLKVNYQSISHNPKENIRLLCQNTTYDCAIVSIPDHLHFDYTMALLENEVHCLVVKPLTPTLSEVQELITTQKKKNCYGAVEFHKRWDETNLYIKKALAENKIGKIIYFTVDYSQRIEIPSKVFKSWADKTNIFQYLGVHYVDLVYFLTNYLPVKAIAVGMEGILKEKGINTFDSVHAMVLWRNPNNPNDEFITHYNINWIDPDCTSALSDQKYKVVGTKGRMECDQKNRGLEMVNQESGIQTPNPYFSEYLPNADGKIEFCGYGHKSISQFINDVKNLEQDKTTIKDLEKCRPTFTSSLVSTAVIQAVNKSLTNNFIWVSIDEIFGK